MNEMDQNEPSKGTEMNEMYQQEPSYQRLAKIERTWSPK